MTLFEKIGAALSNATTSLPPGWMLTVRIESGVCWIELQDPSTVFHELKGENKTLPDQIKAAVGYAKGYGKRNV